MKFRKYLYLVLLIIPSFYISTSSYFHENIGTYSLHTSDPEYIYYICGVSIANGHMKVGNIDHPGTTLQYFLAASFKLTHWIRGNNQSFTEDVLAHPDLFIKVANSALNFSIALVLFLMGYLALLMVPNIWYALIIQFIPFSTDIVYDNLGRITPETIMPVLLIVLSVYLVSILFDKNKPDSWKSIWIFAGIFAVTLALKLTMAFLLLIPFILIPDWKKKLYFAGITVVFFLVFAIPVTLQLSYFWGWIQKILLYSGQYGNGEKTVVNTSDFFPNIKNLYQINKVFFWSAFAFLGSFIAGFASKPENYKSTLNRMSLGVLLVIFLQVLALGKQFKPTYFIPALLLLPLMLVLTAEHLNAFVPRRFSRFVPALVVLLPVLLLLKDQTNVVTQLSAHYENRNTEKMKAYNFLKAIEPESTKFMVVGFYGGPSEEYALMTSYQWAGRDKKFFQPVLAKLFPQTYIYYPWDKTLNYWGNEPTISALEKPVYVYLENDKLKDDFLANIKKYLPEKYELLNVFFNQATNESIYKIVKGASE